MTPTMQTDSVPFLLTRPTAVLASDVIEDVEDGETVEIPASRSVPPHAPPPALHTTEHELPSIIVDLCAVEPHVELQRESEVDGLLCASETVEFPSDLAVPVSEQITAETSAREVRLARATGARSARGRSLVIAAAAALTAAGGTFAGLKATHAYPASLNSLSSVIHAMR